MNKIQIHIHRGAVKDADPRFTHISAGVAAAKRTIADGERALANGDLDLAGRYFISAAVTLENIGKQARSSR